MRLAVLGFVVGSAAWGQSITEFGAAAATGAVGGAAGKNVSDGLTAIFGKVDDKTKADAKSDPAKQKTAKPEGAKPESSSVAATAPAATNPGPASRPAVKLAIKPASGPASGKARATTASVTSPSRRGVLDSVPDPPPPAGQRAAVKSPPPLATLPEPELKLAPILPPPPPPREVTTEDLKSLTLGTVREDVLKMGLPASRITMIDDGHLLEIYNYAAKNATLGVVRLSDGAVSRVEIR